MYDPTLFDVYKSSDQVAGHPKSELSVLVIADGHLTLLMGLTQ